MRASAGHEEKASCQFLLVRVGQGHSLFLTGEGPGRPACGLRRTLAEEFQEGLIHFQYYLVQQHLSTDHLLGAADGGHNNKNN